MAEDDKTGSDQPGQSSRPSSGAGAKTDWGLALVLAQLGVIAVATGVSPPLGLAAEAILARRARSARDHAEHSARQPSGKQERDKEFAFQSPDERNNTEDALTASLIATALAPVLSPLLSYFAPPARSQRSFGSLEHATEHLVRVNTEETHDFGAGDVPDNSIEYYDNVVYLNNSIYSLKRNKRQILSDMEAAIDSLEGDIPADIDGELGKLVSEIDGVPADIDSALRKLSAEIHETRGDETSHNNIVMGKFADKVGRDASTANRLSEAAVRGSSERFQRFLEASGEDAPNANRIAKLHDRFVTEQLPELTVLAAAQELRDQFSPPPLGSKPAYPGKRINPDATGFLFEHYGDEIQSGLLTPGKLQEIDNTLYMALYRDLEGTDRRVADLIAPEGRPYAKRARACAAILGIDSPEEAGRFLGGLRAERIAKHQKAKG